MTSHRLCPGSRRISGLGRLGVECVIYLCWVFKMLGELDYDGLSLDLGLCFFQLEIV